MKVVNRLNLGLMLAAFVAGTVGAILWVRQPMEPLTRENLAQARQRWRDANIPAYEIHYELLGSEYVVRSRNGIVEEVTVNGQVPTSGNWRVYGVEGLFDTLAEELDNAADPAGPFAGGKPVLMRVRFHPQHGYVERYLRSSGGHGKGALIQVIRFTTPS